MEKRERITKYLERINSLPQDGALPLPTFDTLAALQRAHVHSVPFENLDVRRKKEIKIEIDSLFRKIVLQRRGGFCYELNPLFGWLLTELGFEVTYHAAWVSVESDSLGIAASMGVNMNVPESVAELHWSNRTHSFLKVKLEQEEYYVDVGFGDATIHPISLFPLAVTHVHADKRAFRIVQEGTFEGKPAFYLEFSSEAHKGSEAEKGKGRKGWVKRLRWTEEEWTLEEYGPGLEEVCTSPSSPFVQNTIVSQLSLTHRRTLSGMRLLVTELPAGEKEIVTLEKDQLKRVLKEVFRMEEFEEEERYPMVWERARI